VAREARRMRGSLNEQTCGNKPLIGLAVASRRRSTFSHKGRREESLIVMAGLVPAIHVFLAATEDVDARDKPGHDGVSG